MRKAGFILLLAALSFETVTAAISQEGDSSSLGDVARQARLAKRQKDAQGGTAGPGQTVSGESKDVESGASGAQQTTSQSAATTAAQRNAPSAQSKAGGSNGSPSAAARTASADKLGKKVLTDEDMGSSHIPAASPSSESQTNSAELANSDARDGKNPPDYWSTRILAQKNVLASLKSDMDQLSASIQYAPGNCVERCVEWNEQQKLKQQQVESLKAQLEEQQKQLEEMQEGARKQGYGSSVYDP